jgi:hypothetical protein
VREHERAVRLVEVLVEAQARRGTREEARERGLSHRERVAPQVGAVQLDQVERIEEHLRVSNKRRVIPDLAICFHTVR